VSWRAGVRPFPKLLKPPPSYLSFRAARGPSAPRFFPPHRCPRAPPLSCGVGACCAPPVPLARRPLGCRPAGSSPHQTIADSSPPSQVGFSVSLRGDWAVFGVGFVRHLTSSRASETILKTCNSLVNLAVVDFSVASRLLFLLFFSKIHFIPTQDVPAAPCGQRSDPHARRPPQTAVAMVVLCPELTLSKPCSAFFIENFPFIFSSSNFS